ncbi:lactaldehyde dehydrogenase [Methanobacterium alcaliphilum]|uniref:lactaldehyde dehydrogenase n=1 Tax=Methanobacterium alcaliphilum TaxID=392018 RepID=UPI00200A961A|nr:lactaldehyde dehydrogenase [Methanobacterium alcaliphilum]MCK9150338.1 lactaldehyde dehydrogenase [Methanobacterium alcaliphilum]
MEMLINGELIDLDEKIDVLNPFNNDIVGTVPLGNSEHIKKAINAANDAKIDLNNMSSRKISEALYNISNEISEKSDDFSKLITLETGKPISAAKDEVKRSVDTFKFAAEESKRIYGESIPLDAGIGGKGFLGFSIKIPLGVVGAITPFNYPLNLAIHKLAPALAAKNAVILKPSLSAPLTAIKLSKIVADYFPKGSMNVVTGRGSVIGDELVSSDLVNKISFTGGVEVGKRISQKAGMKKITLELGGNDPLIVLGDADLDEAVLGAVRGSYLNAGQVCIAVKRLIVDHNVADEFAEKITKKTLKLNVGDPLNPKTDVGPLINVEAASHVENVVNDAIDKGSQLLCGGERKGNIYMPTVLDYVKSEMPVVNSETFGPISPIIRVNGIEEAIKVANDTQYGLQAGIYTENIHHALKAAKEIDAGSVMINKQSTFRTDNMPFGGFKMSGLGKEGLKYAIEDMTRTKLIVLNTN